MGKGTENLRFVPLPERPGQLKEKRLGIGEVDNNVHIQVGGKFWRRTATLVKDGTQTESRTPPVFPMPKVSRRKAASQLAELLQLDGPEYKAGKHVGNGVFELVKMTGDTLVAHRPGGNGDVSVSLMGSDGIETDSIQPWSTTLKGGLRAARRKLQVRESGGFSFLKKGK